MIRSNCMISYNPLVINEIFFYSRFERIEIISPTLFGRCDNPEAKLSTNSALQKFPCSNSTTIMDYESILEIDNCDWQSLDIAVRRVVKVIHTKGRGL